MAKQLCEDHSKMKQNRSTQKAFMHYSTVKNAPRVLLSHAKAEKNKHEHFDFVVLSFFLILSFSLWFKVMHT